MNADSAQCDTCGERIGVENECPKSNRVCGHHCNCVWTQDCCHWCGAGVNDDGALVPATELCPFCRIVVGRTDTRILYRENGVIVFEPLIPVVAGHVLVVPEQHVSAFTTDPEITGRVMRVAATFTRQMYDAWGPSWLPTIGKHTVDGFNLITSDGAAATQTVMHFHAHIVPRRSGDRLALPWTAAKGPVTT